MEKLLNFSQTALQFFSLFLVFFFPIFGIILSYFVLITFLFNEYFRWIGVAYIVWYIYDFNTPKRGGRFVDLKFNKIITSNMRRYFSYKLIKVDNCELKRDKNYLFCTFPHGFVGYSTLIGLLCNKKMFPQHEIRLAGMDYFTLAPFIREYLMSAGFVSVSKISINYSLSRSNGGNILILLVGGSEEVFHCIPNTYTMVLKKRKGFVRAALKCGASLVPVICFNENNTFDQYKLPPLLRRFVYFIKERTGIPIVLIKMRYFFLPYQTSLTTVVGEPIDVAKTENPTQEEIDNLHALFIEKLTKLFEDHKHKYIEENADNTYLNII